MSFICWGFQSWGQYSRTQQRDIIASFALLVTLLLVQPRIWLTFRAISTQVLFLRAALNPFCALPMCVFGIAWPWCRTLHTALLNFMRLAQSHLSSLSRSLRVVSLPSRVSAAPHTLALLADLRRVLWVPLQRCWTALVPVLTPRECYLSTCSASCWPQIFECNHLGTSLPTEWLIYQIHICPVQGQRHCARQCQTLCMSPGRWCQLLFPHPPLLLQSCRRLPNLSGTICL